MEKLAEAEIDVSAQTVGDVYDYALSTGVIGLFKTEVINQIGPWRSMRDVAWETLKWVERRTTPRRFSRTSGVHLFDILGSIGFIPPAEATLAVYANLKALEVVA